MFHGSRTIVPTAILLTFAAGAILAASGAALSPPAQAAVKKPVAAVDAAKRVPTLMDTAHWAPKALAVRDSLRTHADSSLALRDTAAAVKDSAHAGAGQDSVRAAKTRLRPSFRFESPAADAQACRDGVESAIECWRKVPDLANQEIGFAGPRSWTLSQIDWRPVPQASPYFPAWENSPYLSGGLLPPDRYAVKRLGGNPVALEEIWTPVVPLDTPMTRIDWMRGALTLNVFDFKLERMLSDRVYLGLDYYSATADTVTYDYQFNVHQPYLGGWGFLGKIYRPIDRDSASLVLGGTSASIHALQMRPRVGYWIDSNRVLEFFLDRVSNGSNLAKPTGPPRSPTSLIPSGPDSAQALLPSSLATLTEGVLYGESRAGWTGQAELTHASLDRSEYRLIGDAAAGDRDRIQADLFTAKGTLSAPGLFARPSLTAQARSGIWQGDPLLNMAGASPTEGWSDGEDLDAEIRPGFAFLDLRGQAGLGRASRMDDQVYWLPRYGASAHFSAPLGLGADASISSRSLDPDWEILYRSNPARFRFASPGLKPRMDRTYQGALSWSWSRFSLEAGLDRLDAVDAWLPRVLPGPNACGDLKDGAYAPLAGRQCADSSGTAGGKLTDSLALALRNYDGETVDAWHMGLGLGLGHWSLDLQNRFVFNRKVADGDLNATLKDLSVPERVFKGRLAWKRNLLEEKLKLDFAWDWEWFSTRYAWVPDLAGQSRVGKLDEYLALDFAAAMKIKTFTLYFKVRNFNHDRYATEPGVHPPGLNFRFGVDWTLFN